MRRLVLVLVALALVAGWDHQANAAKKQKKSKKQAIFTIRTDPPGARIEQRGSTIGTTPYWESVPKSFLHGPTSFSKDLVQPLVWTFYKDGYYPKTVVLTNGPFLYRNAWSGVSLNYYTLNSTYLIVLEPIPGRSAQSPPPIPEQGAQSPEADGSTSYGTAFHCWRAGYLVTNYHVIEGADSISVSLDSRNCSASVVVVDKANDLAILRVDDECISRLGLGVPLRLGRSSVLKQGEDVVTYGYPLSRVFNEQPQVSSGILKSTSGLDGDPRMLTISNSVQVGNSGGPLFCRDGSVIGVVTSTLSADYLYARNKTIPQELNFAVKSEYVKLLLQFEGVEPDPAAEARKPFSGDGSSIDLPTFVSRIRSNVVLVVSNPPTPKSKEKTEGTKP